MARFQYKTLPVKYATAEMGHVLLVACYKLSM